MHIEIAQTFPILDIYPPTSITCRLGRTQALLPVMRITQVGGQELRLGNPDRVGPENADLKGQNPLRKWRDSSPFMPRRTHTPQYRPCSHPDSCTEGLSPRPHNILESLRCPSSPVMYSHSLHIRVRPSRSAVPIANLQRAHSNSRQSAQV